MRAVRSLRHSLQPLLLEVHAARLGAVFRFVDALLRGNRLSGTALGRSLVGRSSAKHNIKSADRLLGNKRLFAEIRLFCAAICSVLLKNEATPCLLVDYTDGPAGFVVLYAAVPTDGRALPLYFEVIPKEYEGSEGVHERFLEALQGVLPRGCRPLLVTDAGFRNPWFRAVQRRGWDFLGRICSNVCIRDRADRWVTLSELGKKARSKPRDLGQRVVAKTNPVPGRLVLFKDRRPAALVQHRPITTSNTQRKSRRRAKIPWLLMTSLDEVSAQQIVRLYRTRMQIEEYFRDTKNHRFGWSFRYMRSGSPERISVLLLIAGLANLAITLVGRIGEMIGLHRAYQANTIKERRVLSVFFLGTQILANLTDAPVIDRRKLRLALHELHRLIHAASPQLEMATM